MTSSPPSGESQETHNLVIATRLPKSEISVFWAKIRFCGIVRIIFKSWIVQSGSLGFRGVSPTSRVAQSAPKRRELLTISAPGSAEGLRFCRRFQQQDQNSETLPLRHPLGHWAIPKLVSGLTGVPAVCLTATTRCGRFRRNPKEPTIFNQFLYKVGHIVLLTLQFNWEMG